MKKTTLMAFILVAGCSSQPDNTELYEAGWAQAREDACNCDPFMSEPRIEERARASSAWANGYAQGCRWMNGRPACLDEKPSLAAAQEFKTELWIDPKSPPPTQQQP